MSTIAPASTLDEALANATRALLAARDGAHWTGELSSSPLSTATAVIALRLGGAQRHLDLIHSGVRWLLQNQNDDGGWGDTPAASSAALARDDAAAHDSGNERPAIASRGLSNISTTCLCWAALAMAGDDACRAAGARAEAYLVRTAGSLEPDRLRAAIAARYGKDRTFSVPILTVLALAGKLGPPRQAWRRLPQLPFELAAFPHQVFRFLRLPVVSYALPALIAIGRVRHHFAPTRNPLTRIARALTKQRTLRVLEEIQPASGGFLEAAPLTSFVAMSLIAAGQGDHPVVRRALEFLIRSVRPDGSWPIDTNLATWVTTLSINALAGSGEHAALLSREAQRGLIQWLLGQQHVVEHPYTHAAPGGWAWTDLAGGVPDADDTPGALLALHHLVPEEDQQTVAELEQNGTAIQGQTHEERKLLAQRVCEAARAGVKWLLDLQNRDGGIPTFCRGWGALPFDRSGPDLTAHALLAWSVWRDRLPPDPAQRIAEAMRRALRYLERQQRPDGSWVPLWFGNQHVAGDENPTYGTARVLLALAELDERLSVALPALKAKAAQWLLTAQGEDGGWGGGCRTPASLEETALALQALAAVGRKGDSAIRDAVERGTAWLTECTECGRRFEPAPIGLYFAKLWYCEMLYPIIFTISALSRARSLARSTGSTSG